MTDTLVLNPELGFDELREDELAAVNGGVAFLAIAAWAILAYMASPVIYYAGEVSVCVFV
jgi:lactobin A/cerein 7B family class IIb bacteriocin